MIVYFREPGRTMAHAVNVTDNRAPVTGFSVCGNVRPFTIKNYMGVTVVREAFVSDEPSGRVCAKCTYGLKALKS